MPSLAMVDCSRSSPELKEALQQPELRGSCSCIAITVTLLFYVRGVHVLKPSPAQVPKGCSDRTTYLLSEPLCCKATLVQAAYIHPLHAGDAGKRADWTSRVVLLAMLQDMINELQILQPRHRNIVYRSMDSMALCDTSLLSQTIQRISDILAELQQYMHLVCYNVIGTRSVLMWAQEMKVRRPIRAGLLKLCLLPPIGRCCKRETTNSQHPDRRLTFQTATQTCCIGRF